MKKYIIIVALIFSMNIGVYSQTGSDYYIPLCVGNFTSFYTPENNTYGARKTVYHIKQTDVISSEVAYLQEGYEIGDYTPNDTSIFQQFWLRKDVSGNILMVAINMNNTGLVSDAYIFPVPYLYIPNEYLTLGYGRTFTFGDETIYDTVVSVTATVGTYNNCIVVRETGMTDSVNVIDEYYYAPSVGLVKTERLYHREEIQNWVASLTNILAYNCYVGLQNNGFTDENLITIYPNPASNIVNLEIKDVSKEILKLNIYNILGVLVKTETISNNNQINISDLNNGIYLLALKSKDFTTKQKLIIQK
ncbi:MAG: hypothetical protein H6Q16_2056 [Bacteroidetes bacterium]|nr:hypothetical protein [Bacteroidota bacterium]